MVFSVLSRRCAIIRYKNVFTLRNLTEVDSRIASHIYFKPHKEQFNYQKTKTDQTLISEERAMADFFLQAEDLKKLTKHTMRSAYTETAGDQNSNYYLKTDIYKLVKEKFIEPEYNFDDDKQNDTMYDSYYLNEGDKYIYPEFYSEFATAVSKIRHYQKYQQDKLQKQMESSVKYSKMKDDSKLVVFGLAGNFVIFFVKFVGYAVTGSAAILSELFHSFSDICSQFLRFVGISISQSKPSSKHPYGYSRALYAFSLSSAICVGLFGGALPIYSSLIDLFTQTKTVQNATFGIVCMGVSFVIECATLVRSLIEIRRNCKRTKSKFFDYLRNSSDPTATALFLEDLVSITGIGIAFAALQLSYMYESHLYDALGGISVGALMSLVSYFQMKNNYEALLGPSIPRERLLKIIEILENDKLVLSVNDYKATYLGKEKVRFKAELTLNGRQLAQIYLHNTDVKKLLLDVKQVDDEVKLNHFMSLHCETITFLLATEIDRLEKKIKSAFPEVRHIDLEIS